MPAPLLPMALDKLVERGEGSVSAPSAPERDFAVRFGASSLLHPLQTSEAILRAVAILSGD